MILFLFVKAIEEGEPIKVFDNRGTTNINDLVDHANYWPRIPIETSIRQFVDWHVDYYQ